MVPERLLDRRMRDRTAKRWMQVCPIPAMLSKLSFSPSSAVTGSWGYENEAAFLVHHAADYSRALLEPIEGD